jgi:hypothetical protein
MKKSSAIAAISWNKYYKAVNVTFHSGKTYTYPCTPQEYATFHRVNSPGSFFNRKLAKRKWLEYTSPMMVLRPVNCSPEVAFLSEQFNALVS